MRMALGEACHFYSGTGFPEMYQGVPDGEFPFFKVGDISANVSEGNTYLERCSNYISADVVTAIHGTIIPPDTVVFAKIGEALKKNRRAITTRESLVDNNAMGIAPRKELLRIRYFYYFMCRLQMERFAEATAVPSVRKSRLEQISLDVPSLEKQMYIENVLDAVSSVIKIRQRQLRALDTLIKARFVEMFGECDYPHTELIELILEGAGLSYGIVQPGDDGTGDMGVLRPVDLSDGRITTASIKYIDRSIGDGFKKTELTGEELLITVRGTTGITALTDARFAGMNVTRGIAVVRYDRSKINPVYLNTYLNTEESQRYIQEHTRGATLQQINLSDLRVQQILVPPRALQDEYSAFVQQVDKSKVVVQKALDEAQILFDSLMQKYFG